MKSLIASGKVPVSGVVEVSILARAMNVFNFACQIQSGQVIRLSKSATASILEAPDFLKIYIENGLSQYNKFDYKSFSSALALGQTPYIYYPFSYDDYKIYTDSVIRGNYVNTATYFGEINLSYLAINSDSTQRVFTVDDLQNLVVSVNLSPFDRNNDDSISKLAKFTIESPSLSTFAKFYSESSLADKSIRLEHARAVTQSMITRFGDMKTFLSWLEKHPISWFGIRSAEYFSTAISEIDPSFSGTFDKIIEKNATNSGK